MLRKKLCGERREPRSAVSCEQGKKIAPIGAAVAEPIGATAVKT